MSIIIMGSEKQREAPFLQLSNSIIRNSELSNQALGILVRLLIFPKDWKFSIRGYQKAYPMSGEQKIRTGLEELKEKGYITIKRKREKDGKLSEQELTIFLSEEARAQVRKKASDEKTSDGKASDGKASDGKAGDGKASDGIVSVVIV